MRIPVRVSGACMSPTLEPGAVAEAVPARVYWPGDVVALNAASGPRLVHRVIGYRMLRGRLCLLTQADAGALPDAPVPLERVLGRVGGRVGPRQRLRALARFAGFVLNGLARR